MEKQQLPMKVVVEPIQNAQTSYPHKIEIQKNASHCTQGPLFATPPSS